MTKRPGHIAIFFNLLFCFVCISASSQSAVVYGTLMNAASKPVSFATVYLEKNKTKTIADQAGFFTLKFSKNLNDTLVMEAAGYITYRQHVSANPQQSINLGNIILAYAFAELQQVEITGGIVQSYKSDYSFLATKTQTQLKDIPQSVSTITKELIKDKMDFRLTDAANEMAGVTRYSGYDEFTIRGFRAENPHLINGLRTYNTGFVAPLLVNAERIEVIKGPASVLYGNADPGGTINLVTKKPLQQKMFAADLFAGSYNTWRMQTDITGPFNKNKQLLYRFNAGYENAGSFRNQISSRSYQLAPSLSYLPNIKLQLNFDFSMSYMATKADRGQPGLKNDYSLHSTSVSLSVIQPNDYLKQQDIAAILSLSYKLNTSIAFNTALLNYDTKQNLSEHGFSRYITADSGYLYYLYRHVRTNTKTLSNYFTFQFGKNKVKQQLLAGFDFIKSTTDLTQWHGELGNEFGEGSEIAGTFSLLHPEYFDRDVSAYEHEDDETGEEGDDNDAEAYTTKGIYLQEEISIDKWRFLLSLRQDFYNGEGENEAEQSALLPRIGVVYALQKKISLYAAYSRGFDPYETAAVYQVFNEPFKPIYSHIMEAGAKAELLKSKLFATASVYSITLKNVAVNANDADNPDLFVQRGEERSSGFETELNGNILSNLAVNFSYAYNVARIIKSEKQYEVNMLKENAPKNSTNVWIKYTFAKTLKGVGIAAGFNQASKRNTLTPGLALPGYIIFNTALQYNFSKLSVACNFNNIANKIYWIGGYNFINKWPGAQRNFMLRIGYKLQ